MYNDGYHYCSVYPTVPTYEDNRGSGLIFILVLFILLAIICCCTSCTGETDCYECSCDEDFEPQC